MPAVSRNVTNFSPHPDPTRHATPPHAEKPSPPRAWRLAYQVLDQSSAPPPAEPRHATPRSEKPKSSYSTPGARSLAPACVASPPRGHIARSLAPTTTADDGGFPGGGLRSAARLAVRLVPPRRRGRAVRLPPPARRLRRRRRVAAQRCVGRLTSSSSGSRPRGTFSSAVPTAATSGLSTPATVSAVPAGGRRHHVAGHRLL